MEYSVAGFAVISKLMSNASAAASKAGPRFAEVAGSVSRRGPGIFGFFIFAFLIFDSLIFDSLIFGSLSLDFLIFNLVIFDLLIIDLLIFDVLILDLVPVLDFIA